jgi:hypothetical protein
MPVSHIVPLLLMTSTINSPYYIAIYVLSIIYIITTIFLTEKFPNSFGTRYINFLRDHSSSKAFNMYCGNPLIALKGALPEPEFLKIIFKNGAGKAIVGTGAGLAVEHTLHKVKIGQIYEYKLDSYLNNGKHSSDKQPFSFKDNGPSLLEKFMDRK